MFAYLFDGKGYGSQDSAPGMQVGSSGRGGARFEEEVGSLYDMMVTELNCRNVAIIEGGSQDTAVAFSV